MEELTAIRGTRQALMSAMKILKTALLFPIVLFASGQVPIAKAESVANKELIFYTAPVFMLLVGTIIGAAFVDPHARIEAEKEAALKELEPTTQIVEKLALDTSKPAPL